VRESERQQESERERDIRRTCGVGESEINRDNQRRVSW